VLGSITLAIGASAVVLELRDALNTIWQVPVAENVSFVAKLLKAVRERAYLFGLVIVAGIFLVASMAMNVVISILNARLGNFLPVSPVALHLTIFVVTFLVVAALFAAIYRFVPDVRLRWSDVIVGATFTSLVFTIGKQLLGIYLGNAKFESTYGAAGSLVILLVWMYYSAQLFFFGAEFTKIYSRIFPRSDRSQCH
jgi:membrane protein